MYNKSLVIPGLIITILILLLPWWYNAFTIGLEVKKPVLEKAVVPINATTGEKVPGPCDRFIKDNRTLEIWRAKHMDFVSFYLEYEPKVAQCDVCHKPKFCNDCHSYAGVKLADTPREAPALSQLLGVFRSGIVTEDVHHHRWMKDIIKREDISERRCFACHRDTHCAKCHPVRAIVVE